MKTKLPPQSTLGDELVASFSDFLGRVGRNEVITLRTVALDLHPKDYTPDEIRRLRRRLNVSQAIMARLLGVSTLTIQSWEQGVRTPSPMAMRLLGEVANNLEAWRQKLSAGIRFAKPRAATPKGL